jgi:large subunit ribosomal protein L21
MTNYAIVQTGGKQYHVQAGDTIRVESVPGDVGDVVELKDVLILSKDGQVTLGSPTVSGAKVVAEVVGKGKDEKVVIFKYKAKTRYRRKRGHRQPYTDLKVSSISI